MRKIWRRYKSPFLNAFFLWLFLLLINTDSLCIAGNPVAWNMGMGRYHGVAVQVAIL